MCTPSVNTFLPTDSFNPFSMIKGISTVSDTVSSYYTNKANSAYQVQSALNSAKIAQNEAMRQRQLGIEKSRLEKISALQEVSKLQARNSASNLDSMSQTNKLAYQDALNLANINADTVQKEYNTNANSYFNQANNYYNQASSYKEKYNQSLFSYSMNALNKASQVASVWYENRNEV